MQLSGSWNDLCPRLDGVALARLVWTSVDVTDESGELLWARSIGVARNVSVASDDSGRALVSFTRQESDQKDHVLVVEASGAEINHGAIVGTLRPIALRWREGRYVLIVAERNGWWSQRDALTREVLRREQSPSWGTAGFIDVTPNLEPIWAIADGRPVQMRVGDVAIDYPVTSGRRTVGQGNDPAQLLITDGHAVGTLLVGEAREARVVELPDGRAAVAARVEGGYGVFFDVVDHVPALAQPAAEIPTFPPAPSLAIVMSGAPTDRYGLTWVAGIDGRPGDANPGSPEKIGCLYTLGHNDPKAVRAVCRQYGYAAYVYADGRALTKEDIAGAKAALPGVPIVWLPCAYPGVDLEQSLKNLIGEPTIGVVLPYYTARGAWPIATVFAAQAEAHRLIRKYSLDVAWCFDFDRIDGIVAHPELQESYRRLQASALGDPQNIPGVVRHAHETPSQPPPSGDRMDRIQSQETVMPGAIRRSQNQRYHLMLQHDGNVTLNEGTVEHWDRAVYASGTNVANCALMVSGDGRLVVLNLNDGGQNVYLTPGTESGAYLQVTDDGRLVLMSADGSRELWVVGQPGYEVEIPTSSTAPEPTPTPGTGDAVQSRSWDEIERLVIPSVQAPEPGKSLEYVHRVIHAAGDPDYGLHVNPGKGPSEDVISRLGLGINWEPVREGDPIRLGFNSADITGAADGDTPRKTFLPTVTYRPGATWQRVLEDRRRPIEVGRRDLPALSVRGHRFYLGDEPFTWIGATAFDLPVRLTHGDRRFLDWAAEIGFTLFRVAAFTVFRMPRTPTIGLAMLPRTFDAAASVGACTQVTLFCDTAAYQMGRAEMRAHADAFGRLVADRGGLVCDLFNEIGHSLQVGDATNVDFLIELKGIIQRHAPHVPVCVGSSHGSDHVDWHQGDWMDHHSNRKLTPEDAAMVLKAAQDRHGKPVVDGEPRGCDEQDRGESRYASPNIARRQAEAARNLGLAGTTFHSEAGLSATFPFLGPQHEQCAQAFVEALR